MLWKFEKNQQIMLRVTRHQLSASVNELVISKSCNSEMQMRAYVG